MENYSVDISMDLGGASFARPDNFSAIFAAAGASMDDQRSKQGVAGIRSYFEAAKVTNLWRPGLRLKSHSINADTFKVSSLSYNHAFDLEVIKVAGVPRQILSDLFLVDIQNLPSGQEGYEVKWYFASNKGTKSGGLYQPVGTEVKSLVVSNPTAFTTYNTVDVASSQEFSGASFRKIHYRYVFATNGSSNVEHRLETWTKKPGESGATQIAENTLEFFSGAPVNGVEQNAQDRIRTIKRANLTTGGAYGSLITVSRTREVYSDISGKRRMTSSTRLDSATSDITGLKTTYGYYDDTSNVLLHARKRWQKNPDGSWRIREITANSVTQTIKDISPFKNGTYVLADDGANVASVVHAEARVKTRIITSSQIETYTDVLDQRVNHMKETFETGSAGERILRTDLYDNVSSYITTRTAYRPYGGGTAVDAGRIAWQMHGNGTVSLYSYVKLGTGDMEVTVKRGAGSGGGASTAPSVIAGTKTVTIYDELWGVISVAQHDIATSTALGYQISTTQDLYGRPTRVEYNGESSDYTTTTFGCCGPNEQRDRSGAITKTSYDLLKRVYKTELKRSSGDTPVFTYTGRSGLTTTVTRSAGSTTLNLSETTLNLLGHMTSGKSPDADGVSGMEITTYLTEYPAGGGMKRTTTYPDTTTTITETYRDGRTEKSTDQESNVTGYDYGTHTTDGGGLWSKTISPITTQWTKSYTDHLGRGFKTEYPDGAGTCFLSSDYYESGDNAGSRGQLKSSTDPDENAAAGTGTTVSYAYNAEGERTTTTKAIADSQTRTTVTDTSVVTDPDLGTAQKSTTTVNGKLISTSYRSADGYASKSVTLAGTSISTRTIPNNGAWTVTSTTPDGQTTIQTYTDGQLQTAESFDNTGITASDLIASMSYTYDALGRTLTTVDSRTGTTTVNGYTDAGAVTSVTTNGGTDITSYTYDVMGRRLTTTLPDTSVTYTSYTDRAQTLATWGSQTYARLYQYDSLGRMSELRTYQNLTQGTEPTTATAGYASTEWLYDSQRGWLTEKNYNGETDNGTTDADYTYTASGRLLTRTWERGITTTYSYDQGSLDVVAYSDSTPGVSYTYEGVKLSLRQLHRGFAWGPPWRVR